MVIEWAGVRSTGREGMPVLSVVNDDGTTPNGFLIDAIVREGARRMLAATLEAEVNASIRARCRPISRSASFESP
ncbi:hypothetical protein [Streptomyces sp. NPDC058295]|uniref:hypothetical protein n=1 Tax=Streptomyces sp. NPDC058295 TaxID=3346431 RepID=UPI0036EFB530